MVTPQAFKEMALELGFVFVSGKKSFLRPALGQVTPSFGPVHGARPKKRPLPSIPAGRVASVVRQWPRPAVVSDEDSSLEPEVPAEPAAASGPVQHDLEANNPPTDQGEGSYEMVDAEVEVDESGMDGMDTAAETLETIETDGEKVTGSEFEFVAWPPESPPSTPRVKWAPEDFDRLKNIITNLGTMNRQLLVFNAQGQGDGGDQNAAAGAAAASSSSKPVALVDLDESDSEEEVEEVEEVAPAEERVWQTDEAEFVPTSRLDPNFPCSRVV